MYVAILDFFLLSFVAAGIVTLDTCIKVFAYAMHLNNVSNFFIIGGLKISARKSTSFQMTWLHPGFQLIIRDF